MATTIKTIGMNGLEGYVIKVQAYVLRGVTSVNIVGLADKAIKESRDRVESCFDMMSLRFPKGKIVINLTPGDVKKNGGYLDLPMFLSLGTECGQLSPDGVELEETVFFGGISLDGELEAFTGMMPMLIEAKKAGFKNAVIPNACMSEAARVRGLNCFGFDNIHGLVEWLEGRVVYYPKAIEPPKPLQVSRLDFDQVKGQEHLIKFVTAAAAGGHNLLLVGPAGCGKSMIAQRLETILPDMNDDEVLEVMAIHSIAGILRSPEEAVKRPFRSVHYNASANAIIGGGSNAKPGEISLAHNGVLFLDELPEFSRVALEALRQPLEDRKVRVARVNKTNVYPANFMLVAAMNPCPCGNFGSGSCSCSPHKVRSYRQRISGPILDRMDIQKFMSKVDLFGADPVQNLTPISARSVGSGDPCGGGLLVQSGPLSVQGTGDEDEPTGGDPKTSASLKARVIKAREIQAERFKTLDGVRTNAQMDAKLVEQYCAIDQASSELIQSAHAANHFSARSYHKILKVARTFADLDGSESIRREDVVSALMARDLDRLDATPLKGW